MKNWRWWLKWLIGILIVIGIGLAIYYFWEKNEEKKFSELTFETVTRQNLESRLTVAGNVQAKKSALLRFATGGKIVSSPAKEGSYVKTGQLIAAIDQRLLQKQLDLSLNTYSMQRLDWDQQLDDIKDRTIDKREQRQVDKNQLLLDRSVLNVEISDIQVKDAAMTAPFNGVIINSPIVSTGYYISPAEGYTLVDPATLVFTAYVDESDIAKIYEGQSANISLDAYDDETLPATVKTIAYQSVIRDTSQTFAVDFPLDDPTLQQYRIGMSGNADILLQRKVNVLVVDSSCITEDNGVKTVQVKNGEKLETREVTTGLETDEAVEITSGLSEGDEVLVPSY